jgi:hypothetical protein
MKQTYAFLLLGAFVGIVWWLWIAYRRFMERSRLAEERMAGAITQATTSARSKAAEPAVRAPTVTAPKPAEDLAAMAQQKLLYDAASKAGEAGEAVLSIQLYARLLARYPESMLGAQARAAVETQKKKLAKPSAPPAGVPG